jgi:aminoglycoside/choline kinase family phosphotransferase
MQVPTQGSADRRRDALIAWLRSLPLDAAVETLRPASADASFRRYFRVDAPGHGTLADAGLNVPAIVAADVAQGFLLLTDLGTQTYLDVLNESNADALYRDAIAALVKWQQASRAGVLPPYDEAALRRELDLFADWYVARHLGIELDARRREVLAQQYRLILDACLAQPCVYVHRDFMPRNLMPLADGQLAVLDFQDAVAGPIAYDVLSLFKDAFLSWPAEFVEWGLARYHERARHAGLPVPALADFRRDVDLIGVQRHLKVLGIFARLNHRDGKPKYLADAPRFLRYLLDVLPRYPALDPLRLLLEEHVLPQLGALPPR